MERSRGRRRALNYGEYQVRVRVRGRLNTESTDSALLCHRHVIDPSPGWYLYDSSNPPQRYNTVHATYAATWPNTTPNAILQCIRYLSHDN